MMATAKEPNGVATITRPDCACYARRLIAGGAALFLVLASVLTYLFIGATDIAQRYAPLVDAAMEIKLEATTAHLWLEEILSGDRQEHINEVWQGLERADWYAGAMLDGARNAEGHYLPLRDPALRSAIERVRQSLAEFREIAEVRHNTVPRMAAGSDIDQRFDAVFADFISQADRVETLLQREIASTVDRLQDTFLLLALFLGVLFISTTTLLYRGERQRSTTYAKLLDAHQTISRKTLELEYVAHFDSVSGLPNRLLCYDRLNQAIDHAARARQHLALIFIDLDNFKTINDSLGHPAGDRILRSFGDRALALIRNDDTLARLGGDEFTLIMPHIGDRDMAVKTATRLATEIGRLGDNPVRIGDQSLHITASMGIAIYPNDGNDAETLMRNADIAMYQAKREGRNNYQFFSKALDQVAHQRLQMETELREAINNDQLVLHYQPYFGLGDQKLAGAEVLVRWNHPQKGLLMPGAFIGIAEETGLIIKMGEWILRSACQQFLDWRTRGFGPGVLSVNLSAVQFNDPGLIDTLKKLFNDGSVPPHNIQLEITETAVMHNSEQSMKHLNALDDMGFQLAIDDFGTGYSSMAYLKHFPVDHVKIDMAFVRDIGKDRTSDAIIRGMIDLARNLELETIAEGIETEAQRDFLRQHGCTTGQGYLLARPMPAHELEAQLLADKAPNAVPFRSPA